jgi:hypothetical protein
MRHVGPGLAWRERQPFQAKLPVEPMPAAVRTQAQASQRQENRQEKRQAKRQAKHREKIVPLRFACGYRLGTDSRDGALS